METLSMAVLKKASDMEQMGEIMLIGDQLRLRFHEDKIIKDRRHHLNTYPNCFIAKEAIDWLIDRKEAADRPIAIELLQKMMEHNILHHVCDELKEYKDARLYYRFRKDDGTYPMELEVKVFLRGQRICDKVMSTDNGLLQTREEDGVKYDRCFVASDFINWLLYHHESKTRTDAEQLGRRLLEHAVIQHVTSKFHFVDSNLLYQFRVNFRRRRRFMELLIKRPQTVLETQDSPFCVRKQTQDRSTSFHSASSSSDSRVSSGIRRTSMSGITTTGFVCGGPPIYCTPPVVLCNPRSVLKRPVTVEELLAPGAPYNRKTLTIVSDVVGWGFVVRGNKPCHIQAVDPSGPAVAAGMKIRQFVVSVNGLNVLNCDFRTVSNHILTGPRTIVMEIMEEINP